MKRTYEYTIFKRRSSRGKAWYQAWDGPHERSATARRIKDKLYPGRDYIIARTVQYDRAQRSA